MHRGAADARARRAGGWRGFSLVEVVVAGMILTAALIPIISNFQSLFRQYKKTHQTTHALNIAQCILESIRYRLFNGDSRFFKLNDPGDERIKRLPAPSGNGTYAEFFLTLRDGVDAASGERGIRVTEVSPGSQSQYFRSILRFRGAEPQGITDSRNPVLFRQLDTYRVAVRISLGTPQSPLDSEPNGRSEIDMCEIEVEISWRDSAGKDQSQSLYTMLTRRQYNQFPDGQP